MATLLCESPVPPNLPDIAGAAASLAAAAAAPDEAPFSSIALFECTIHNAQMLLESMELADLVLALRIVSQLHGRLVEFVEPSAARIIRLAELCSGTKQSADEDPATATKTSSAGASSSTKRNNNIHSASNNSNNGRRSSTSSTVAHSNSRTTAASVKLKSTSVANLKTSPKTPTTAVVAAATKSSSSSSRSSRRRSSAAPGYLASSTSVATGHGSSAGSTGKDSATKGLTDSWKQLLRRAYRVLLSEGQELFDFTKSYSAPGNRAAAEIIINRAVAMSSKPTPDVKSWKNLFTRYLEQWYRKTLKPTHCKSACRVQMSMDKKLNQRRRSLQSLLTLNRLSPATGDRMAALLERDMVSSDEEEPDGCLYVKLLPWETLESARLKSTLDGHYAEELADEREKLELARVRRHPGYVSSRRVPADAPDWAVDKSECAGAAAAAAAAAAAVSTVGAELTSPVWAADPDAGGAADLINGMDDVEEDEIFDEASGPGVSGSILD